MGMIAEKTPRFLVLLRDMADDDDVTPSVDRYKFAERMGITSNALSSLFGALQHIGCITLVEPGKPGRIGRYKITGAPYRQVTRDGRIVPKTDVEPEPVHAPLIDDAKIAKRLKDKYGIEIATRHVAYRGGFTSGAGPSLIEVSLPRVKFLEGAAP